MNRRGRRTRWAAAAMLAAALAGCSSSNKTTTGTTTTTTASTTTSSTAAASVSTTVGSRTSTPGRVTTTTRPTAATATTAQTTAPPTTVVANVADNGHTVTMHVGDTLQVELSGCGGCGYQWEMTGQPSSVVFQYEGETNSSTSTTTTTVGQAPVVGAPVTYTWTFRAVSAHTTGFVAGYYPPSQKAPTEAYSLRLTVITG